MYRILLLLLPSIFCAASSAKATTADFKLNDFRGKSHHLADYRDSDVVVLAFMGTECPLVKLYGPVLQRLHEAYSERGVSFIGVNSNKQDSITDIAAFVRRQQITFPMLKDVGNVVADQFEAERTPSVVVLNSKREIAYHGRIDDQYGIGYARDEPNSTPLVDAVEALLGGRSPEVTSMPPEGCLIGRVREIDASAEVTYGSHIAKILSTHCVKCHREGEIAPFALTSYSEAAGWAEMIREVVDDQRMPPWHANPAHGSFSNERRMTTDEKQLITDWVLAGAPAGDLASVPELPPKAIGWQLANDPDQVVAMEEEYNVPAEGIVEYKYFQVDPGFTEDKWIRAAEVVPGTRDVVHHILVFARKRGDRGDDFGAGGGEFLAAYVPGLRAAVYPQGMAKLVPAGSKLIFQMHYTPVGEPRTDSSSIGLYFADPEDVTHTVVTQEARCQKDDLKIPPNTRDFEVTSRSPGSPVDLKLLSLMPHMHLRGQSFRYQKLNRDGTRETLLDIPRYDFNWQTSYALAEPIDIGKGERILCDAKFDNSKYNLNNPNPDRHVRWGDQTNDEMMIGYFDVAVPRQDAGIDRANIEAENLLSELDRNGDGKIQKREVTARLLAAFRQADANSDQEVTLTELTSWLKRRRR